MKMKAITAIHIHNFMICISGTGNINPP